MGRMVWGGRHVQPGPSTGAARRLADERSEREELQRGPGREARTLLDVVVREGAAVLELLAREDEALLVRRNALLVLDLLLHVLDRVRRLHIKGNGLAREGLDEDLRWSEGECRVVGGRVSLFLSEACGGGVRRAAAMRR